MNDDASNDPIVSKRRAWIFTPDYKPGIADFRAGGERRQVFIRYWVKDNVQNLSEILFYFAMGLLPVGMCSNLGAAIGNFVAPRWYKAQEQRARHNLRRLFPDMSAEEEEARILRYRDAQGRLLTEFSVLHRLGPSSPRVTTQGLDQIIEAAKTGPVIIVAIHVGNWEVISRMATAAGIKSHTTYVPPRQRGRAWIAQRVRLKAGIGLIPPGQGGIRPALKILKAGGMLSIFCDEAFQGQIRGPLFGRKPHLKGNLAVAVRMARMSGAALCPVYAERTDGVRFVVHGLPPLRLPEQADTSDRLLDDVALLNSVIEPVVLKHIDQWYFLDNTITDD